MAHRTNVNQVKMDFPNGESEARVKDPVCGFEMKKREAKHVLFREAEPDYFCSRACLDLFRISKRQPKAV